MSSRDYVTVRIDGQLFGVETRLVQDVFHPRHITPVPLSSAEVLGLLNLRGRIVTAVCARRRLGLGPRPAGAPEPRAVGLEIGGDSYGLVVDQVEAVVKQDLDALVAAPDNLSQQWAEVVEGVFRLPGELLVILDIDRLLGEPGGVGAAA